MFYMRRRCKRTEILGDGTLFSEWSPFCGVTVETYITPFPGGHKRRHIIKSDGCYTAYDCAFATPDGSGGILGDGEAVALKSSPNMNLTNNLTYTNAVRYNIKKGETGIETTVYYPEKQVILREI